MKNSLKVHRARFTYTQGELADKIGVSRQTINSIESDKCVPSTVLTLKLALTFDVSTEEIFELEEND